MTLDHLGKKTLVLDLDETLVHSTFVKPAQYDIELKVDMLDREFIVYVLIRPGYFSFINELAQHFEIVIWTASLSQYAGPLIDKLDPQGLCAARLYREHCTLLNTMHVKDLSRLGRPLENIIIVDNSSVCYKLHPHNAIPIKSWHDDMRDTELLKLMPFLVSLSYVEDVRTVLQKCVTICQTGELDKDCIDIQKGSRMIELLQNGPGVLGIDEEVSPVLEQGDERFEKTQVL